MTQSPHWPDENQAAHAAPDEQAHPSISDAAGLPAAVPTGSSDLGILPEARRLKLGLRGLEDSLISPLVSGGDRGPDAPGRRVSARRLARLRRELSERDWLVLTRVAEHRYLTSAQVERLVFNGHASAESAARTARRVLARLARDGLLRALPRRIGGVRAGSGATVWQLAPAGARLLSGGASGHRVAVPSQRFLEHCLAVAETHLELTDLRDRPGVVSVSVQIEPLSYRPFTGLGGERRRLKPDMAVEVVTREFEDRWFVEVDRGTESLPTLLGKCQQYMDYRASGLEQAAWGGFPLVLWVMDGPGRDRSVDRLGSAIARSRALLPELFRLCLPGQVAAVVGSGL